MCDKWCIFLLQQTYIHSFMAKFWSNVCQLAGRFLQIFRKFKWLFSIEIDVIVNHFCKMYIGCPPVYGIISIRHHSHKENRYPGWRKWCTCTCSIVCQYTHLKVRWCCAMYTFSSAWSACKIFIVCSYIWNNGN